MMEPEPLTGSSASENWCQQIRQMGNDSIIYGFISPVHWTPVKWNAANMSQRNCTNAIKGLNSPPSTLMWI